MVRPFTEPLTWLLQVVEEDYHLYAATNFEEVTSPLYSLLNNNASMKVNITVLQYFHEWGNSSKTSAIDRELYLHILRRDSGFDRFRSE